MSQPDHDHQPTPPYGDEADEPTGPSSGNSDQTLPHRPEPLGVMPTPEEVSSWIPGYSIDRLIGRGGMGAVYHGSQESIQREVAVKLLPSKKGEQPDSEARFRREARAMGKLNHSNIVQIYDFGETESGYFYITMEYVDGTDLRQLMALESLKSDQAMEIVAEICSALSYAHSRGFIHRDIKPANILVNRKGTVKVADFGLAKIVERESANATGPAQIDETLTAEGVATGTLDYMAPERLSGESEDHRSDLYSLGVMFYQMLTGELPKGAVKVPSEKVSTLDERLDDIVFRAMESAPDHRYQSATEFRTDVETVSEGNPVPHQTRKTRTRSSRFTAIALVLASVLGAAVVWQKSNQPVAIPPVAPVDWSSSTPVAGALAFLGEESPAHAVSLDEELVKTGKRLVFEGQITNAEGGSSPLISHYFRCSDCHNSAREDSNLAQISDPLAKLNYAIAAKIPLLQGSTFAGMVNRESWYNDDYAKKYRFSPTVQMARSDLRKAIELCCNECSQGRAPEKWEEEALLAYFWSLQWKLGDLGVTDTELADWKTRAEDPEEHRNLVATIKSHYSVKSPATFGVMPSDTKTGFDVEGEPDLELGEQVFKVSCLHCHDPVEGAAETHFKDRQDTYKDLQQKFRSSSRKSAYGHIRLGTHPEQETGKRLYMPNYTKERLSDHQIESLRAWLESK